MNCKTLSDENKFTFKCPIFKADVGIRSCFELRDKVWRGEQIEVRKGCQVAMHAGKCPVPNIVKDMVREKSDPYYAPDPTVRPLGAEVLDRIAPVVVSDKAIETLASSMEQKLLRQANEDARNGVRQVTKKPRREERVVMEDVPASKPIEAPVSSTVSAAQSGDMTAAINEGMKS